MCPYAMRFKFKLLKHQCHSHMIWTAEFKRLIYTTYILNLLWIDLRRTPPPHLHTQTHTAPCLSWLAAAASANPSVTPSPGSITEGILQGPSKEWKRLDDWSGFNVAHWSAANVCTEVRNSRLGCLLLASRKSEAEKMIYEENNLLTAKSFINKNLSSRS